MAFKLLKKKKKKKRKKTRNKRKETNIITLSKIAIIFRTNSDFWYILPLFAKAGNKTLAKNVIH